MKTDFIIAEYDGEAFVPIRQYQKHCDENFVVGEKYRFTIQEERSVASHNQYFARLHDLWQSLPEQICERFPTQEHLRKYALIRTGYYDSRSFPCASKTQAQEMARFMRPSDEFSVVTAKEAVVTVYTAKSQSLRAMGKNDFQASKQAVLEFIEGELIGIGQRRAAA